MFVFFNGAIIPEEKALLPFTDRGVLFGDGLFETLRAYQGKPFRLGRHLERMEEGCRLLRLPPPPGEEEMRGILEELYRRNVAEGDGYVRITMTGGPFDGTRSLARSGPCNLHVVVKPFQPYPEEWYRRGVRLAVSGIRRNEHSFLSRVKSNNYLASLAARQEALDRGADDAVLLNTSGHLCEAPTSNIFLVRDGKVCTPAVDCGLLPGITRQAVLELCTRLRLPAEEGRFRLEDLLAAEEAFLTVSTGEIVPVAEVEGTPIGKGAPGTVTIGLTRAYRELVKEELGLD